MVFEGSPDLSIFHCAWNLGPLFVVFVLSLDDPVFSVEILTTVRPTWLCGAREGSMILPQQEFSLVWLLS